MQRSLTARLLAAASLLAVSAAAAPALAQSAEEPIGTVRVEGEGDFTIAPPADDGYRATRTTTATRTETELRDVPQAITVVTQEQIRDQAIDSMADAVLYVPGVSFAQGEGNRDTPVFRGNATTGDFYVDGIRDDVQFYRDVYNVERIEVLKGPNGMVFGRGGAGGVINRVTKVAGFDDLRELHLELGSDNHRRGTIDIGGGVSDTLALRVTGVLEDSESYRDGVYLQRWGVNPTMTVRPNDKFMVTLGYERFEDERTADRGIPSYLGRPVGADRSTFFGDPDLSYSDARVDAFTAAFEYRFDNGMILRNRTRLADYYKFYQNVFPGAVNGAGTTVAINAYNNETERLNFINQTDLNWYFDTGSIRHTLLMGVEYGQQDTRNFRQTGYFTSVGPNVTSIQVPLSDPTLSGTVVEFRQSATDANNSGLAEYVGVYAQDQMQLTETLQLVAGVRFDNFDVSFRNNRTLAEFESSDDLWSPRLGLIWRPIEPLTLYASYTKGYVPRAGDQLSSLSLSNQALDPEEFDNYEVGLKWDARPDFTVTAAVFQLDRANVLVTDPLDPTRSLLIDGQSTTGVELSAAGRVTERWSMVASYAWLDTEITRTVGTSFVESELANTPEHSFALWNRYDVTDRLGASLGVIYQGERFAAVDNAVVLPDFWRVDAGVFYDLTDTVSAQVNVENVLDEEYFPNAHSNNNITPGAGRLFKAGLTVRF